jgi:hypothetical protein
MGVSGIQLADFHLKYDRSLIGAFSLWVQHTELDRKRVNQQENYKIVCNIKLISCQGFKNVPHTCNSIAVTEM